METLLFIVLLLIFTASLIIGRAVKFLPLAELRHRSRLNRKSAAGAIYQLARYGRLADRVLLAANSAALAGLLYMAFTANTLLGLALSAALPLVMANWRLKRAGGWPWLVAALGARAVTSLLAMARPPAAQATEPAEPAPPIFEKADLVHLLNQQGGLPENRIDHHDLRLAGQALSLNDQPVQSLMTPLAKLRFVAAQDPIAPQVMDELHRAGQRRFPVVKKIVKSGEPEIIGYLYIDDLLGQLDKKGRIRDIMRPAGHFIHKNAKLAQALKAFAKCETGLLLVVNDQEALVGTLTVDDVLRHMFGRYDDHFDQYSDRRAVATSDSGVE